jgi:hypothetical protein
MPAKALVTTSIRMGHRFLVMVWVVGWGCRGLMMVAQEKPEVALEGWENCQEIVFRGWCA